MSDSSAAHSQILTVTNFKDLVSTPFHGKINAICWSRNLKGDFSEIIEKVPSQGNITVVEPDELRDLKLSEEGSHARDILLSDLALLSEHGASPSLNVIRYYERDNDAPYFPTDVYSFHVDRSPVPTNTFLCTYYGEPSELLSNSQARQKVFIPEIRESLIKNFRGSDRDFDLFLQEHFLDLHYQPDADAIPVNLGPGNLWKLAVDHPGSKVLPCIHRAPAERPGQARLLLIC